MKNISAQISIEVRKTHQGYYAVAYFGEFRQVGAFRSFEDQAISDSITLLRLWNKVPYTYEVETFQGKLWRNH